MSPAGELVSVVGPSGCGRSTLLRIASGLSQVSEGQIGVQTGKIGYVFQDPTLLPWRTVQGNVELFAELRGLPKDERRRRADDAIKLVRLSDFARHHPRALSGGMRMRVSVARSLTLQPELFLFDEPFEALDEITRERLNDELLQLFLTQRFSALFVTHSVIRRCRGSDGPPMSVVTGFTGPTEATAQGRITPTPRLARRGRGSWLSIWGPPAAVLVAVLTVWYGVSISCWTRNAGSWSHRRTTWSRSASLTATTSRSCSTPCGCRPESPSSASPWRSCSVCCWPWP